MKRWYKEVFNYFDANCEYTNAASEGTNCLIQGMNSLGNGYSLERLRARALYWHKAAPRISYAFNKKSIAKTRAKNQGNNWTTGLLMPGRFKNQYETYYEDVDILESSEIEGDYKCTSVYSYARVDRKVNPEGFID